MRMSRQSSGRYSSCQAPLDCLALCLVCDGRTVAHAYDTESPNAQRPCPSQQHQRCLLSASVWHRAPHMRRSRGSRQMWALHAFTAVHNDGGERGGTASARILVGCRRSNVCP